MAQQELSIGEVSDAAAGRSRSGLSNIVRTVTRFARRKPLGAACAFFLIICFIISDFVPEIINLAMSTVGLGKPVPYLIDALADRFHFIYDYGAQNLRDRLAPRSSDHLLGTDQFGRDIFSRLLYGARVVVTVSLGAVFISEGLGSIIGILSGYYGRWVDKFLYRLVDIAQALPGLVLLITILGTFGTGLWQMTIAIGLIGVPSASRLVRGQTISVMATSYIEAARVLGASDLRIMRRYVLPNIFAIIVLSSTVRLGAVVLIEATVSFLGFGLPPPFPSWGQMLSLEGREFLIRQPGLAIYPGLAIAMLVFSYNIFGDALRDVLDPRLRGSR